MDHKFQWLQQGLNYKYISYNILLVIRKLGWTQTFSSLNRHVITGICDK